MKYIIELEKIDDTGYYTVKDTDWVVGDITKGFTPYTEPTQQGDCGGCNWEDNGGYLYEHCYHCVRCPKERDSDLYEPKPKKTIKRWEQYEGDFVKAHDDFLTFDTGDCTNCRLDIFSEDFTECFAYWLMEDIEVDDD